MPRLSGQTKTRGSFSCSDTGPPVIVWCYHTIVWCYPSNLTICNPTLLRSSRAGHSVLTGFPLRNSSISFHPGQESTACVRLSASHIFSSVSKYSGMRPGCVSTSMLPAPCANTILTLRTRLQFSPSQWAQRKHRSEMTFFISTSF